MRPELDCLPFKHVVKHTDLEAIDVRPAIPLPESWVRIELHSNPLGNVIHDYDGALCAECREALMVFLGEREE
jgi:hypothetical protein